MTLPKIKHPLYNETIPSSGTKIKFRPFTVKEEKIVLMAKESEEISDKVDCMKQILSNCIVNPSNFNIDKITTFDIEYLFIKLRAKSIGEMIEIKYIENDVTYTADLNLEQVKVVNEKEHTNTIILDQDIGVKMKYPSFDQLFSLTNTESGDEDFDLMLDCIECVFQGDNVYTPETDFSREELTKFIEELPLQPLQKISNFFKTMPSIKHTIELKSKDGKTKEVTLKGINDFFTL